MSELDSDAAAVAAGVLPRLSVGGRPLLIDEETGDLARAVRRAGADPVVWLRREIASGASSPWPPDGPFTSALLRLPKAKEALDFALHAAAASIPQGATIGIFGGNDEGIRSAARHLDVVASGVETIDVRRRCRVLTGVRRDAIEGLKPSLAQWRCVDQIELTAASRPWVSYPGVFARGTLDPGTRLLLATFPTLPRYAAKARLLDFAAGTGVVAAALSETFPAARIDMIEIDALALAAARENVPTATACAGASLAASAAMRFDLIISNPPVHDGIRTSTRVLEQLVRDAVGRLARGGELRVVVLRQIEAAPLMAGAFGADKVSVVSEDGRFRVLKAVC